MLNLTPSELFFIYETLMNTVVAGAEQQENKQFVLSKVREELLDTLDSLKSESNKALYGAWMNQETQRLKDLSRKNDDLKTSVYKSEDQTVKTDNKRSYTKKSNSKKRKV